MEIKIDIDEDVYTRLFDNGIEDNEIATDDICKMARSLRNGTPLRPNGNWTRRHYINGDKTLDMWVCSHCGEEFSYDAETGVSIYDYDYCPNCGDYKRNKAEGGIE